MGRADRSRIQALCKQLKEEGRIRNSREDIVVFLGLGEGIVRFNTTRIVKLDPMDLN